MQGFIGCELASTCRQRVLDVTIVDVSRALMTRGLGEQLGTLMGDVHSDHGVKLHLGVAVTSWTEHPDGVTVELANGERLDTDLAVVGVGTTPAVDWLTGTAIDTSDGVLCTRTCHVVGVEDVVACGDVARWPNERFETEPRRCEHWLNAIEMGQHVAESLLLGPETARPFTPIPRFWSEQHGHRIQAVGRPDLGEHMTIVDGSSDRRRFVATFEHQARIVGAIAMDSPRRMIALSHEIAAEWPANGMLAERAA